MKKFYFFAVVLVAVALVATLCGCNAADTVGKNMISSDKFNDDGFATLIYEKTDDSSANVIMNTYWSTTGTASGSSVKAGENGVVMNTAAGGYATLSQEVKLRTNSYYKVTYTYSTSAMSIYDDSVGTYEGLYVTFLEDEDFNRIVATEGSNEDVKNIEERGYNAGNTVSVYFKVGNLHQATLAFCLGSEEKPVNCSEAVISNIKLERVKKADIAEGTNVLTLTSDEYGEAIDFNVLYVVLGAIGTLAVGYAIYMTRARLKAKEELGESDVAQKFFAGNKWVGFATTAGVALVIRLLIFAIQSGLQGAANLAYFGYDMEQSYTFGSWLGKYGTPYFFEYNSTAEFMPVALYLQALAGAMTSDILGYAIVMKLMAILADVGTAILIYMIVAKKRGSLNATLYASLYSLLPAVFAMSSAWGTMESIAVFSVVLTFYFILDKKYIASSVAYFFATMTSTAALIVVPFVLLYAGILCYKGIKEKNYINLVKVLGCMAGGILLFFLISLPFAVNQMATDGDFAFTQYIATVKGLNVYSHNAFNFQGMIGNNFKSVSTESTFITIVFVVFIVAVLAVPYYKSRSRLNLTGIAAIGALAYWYFCNNCSQDGLLVILPLMVIFSALVEDKRLFAMTTLLGAMAYINSSYFYLVADSESAVAQIAADAPVTITMGVFMLVYIIALVIIDYDVIVSKKCKEQLSLKVSYLEYVSSVATNAVIGTKNAYYKSIAFLKGFGKAVKETIEEWKAKKAGKQNVLEEDEDDNK